MTKPKDSDENEVGAWSEKTWKLECPECKEVFLAPDDECMSGSSFTAECQFCHHKFTARAI